MLNVCILLCVDLPGKCIYNFREHVRDLEQFGLDLDLFCEQLAPVESR